MADIKIIWDPEKCRGDWNIIDGDLETGDDLETSILVALFTDRVLPEDETPPDGSNDHRGWWADTYTETPVGSRLWTLYRCNISSVSGLLQKAKDICNEALAYLVSDSVASSVGVQTSYLAPERLGIAVTVQEPSGSIRVFRYAWAWREVFT